MHNGCIIRYCTKLLINDSLLIFMPADLTESVWSVNARGNSSWWLPKACICNLLASEHYQSGAHICDAISKLVLRWTSRVVACDGFCHCSAGEPFAYLFSCQFPNSLEDNWTLPFILCRLLPWLQFMQIGALLQLRGLVGVGLVWFGFITSSPTYHLTSSNSLYAMLWVVERGILLLSKGYVWHWFAGIIFWVGSMLFTVCESVKECVYFCFHDGFPCFVDCLHKAKGFRKGTTWASVGTCTENIAWVATTRHQDVYRANPFHRTQSNGWRSKKESWNCKVCSDISN